MAFTRKSIADHLDSYDDEIAELQDSKREMLADYRQQLADAGMGKAQIKAEIEALKTAMRRRRTIAKTSETEVEEADALADEIFVEITSSARRAMRVASAVPDHDPITGEITDTQEQPETATKSAADSRVGDACGVQGKTEPQTSAPAESASDKISAPHSPSDAASSDAATAPQAPQAVAASHRSMSISPLEPREAGGLKGFGFTVKFEDKPLNPDCRKAVRGEQCALMHSQALCSKCQQEKDARRVAA